MPEPESTALPRSAVLAIIVAALGYFVDIYDLILFSVVRTPSLISLGVPSEQLLATGVRLLDMQMAGMLLGGILWGVLADRQGRLSVLFASIVTYSLANIANGFVQDVETYAWLRLIAGIGLAGELGVGVTLVSELMGPKLRGIGTTLVASIGILGAIAAVLVAKSTPWHVAYWIGGALGMALLSLQVGVLESGMFKRTAAGTAGVARGNFLALFSTFRRARKYLAVVLSAVPIWAAVGVLVTFAPEIGLALGMTQAPSAADAVLATYVGLAIGDLASGALSQVLQSRKRAVGVFLALDVVAVSLYFLVGSSSSAAFIGVCVLLGIANGYWAVFVTVAAEQFGTNLRATAATTAPNFVRGGVVPLTLGFQALAPRIGAAWAALSVVALTLVLAAVALYALEETYGKDLDFLET